MKAICISLLVLATLTAFLNAPAESAVVEVGDRVDYRFNQAVINGYGLERLSDLRGRPVLVEFWGHR